MKWLKRCVFGLVSLVVVACLLLLATGNGHILRGIPKTYLRGLTRPDINDMDLHHVREVHSGLGEPWAVSAAMGEVQLPEGDLEYLSQYGSEALLMWQGDSLILEHYWNQTDQNTHFNSFSMAKSFAALAVGVAIDRGEIPSVEEPLGTYLTAYQNDKDADLKLKHLLQMASGIDFGESYSSPFGYMAKAYFGTDLEQETLNYHVSKDPGTEWKYEGGNSVLLGLALQKATGKNVSDYFSKHIWQPIGATNPAYWNLDKAGDAGLEKTFSAFYATPRDFGRVGKLILNRGTWKGKRLLSEEWFDAAMQPCGVNDSTGEPTLNYGYHMWLYEDNRQPVPSCSGMRGQYILALPHLDMVVVRIGHNREELSDGSPVFVTRLIKLANTIHTRYAQRHSTP